MAQLGRGVEAVRAQKGKYLNAKTPVKQAQEMSSLLILSLYSPLPPARSLNMRQLRISVKRCLQRPSEKTGTEDQNQLYLKKDGSMHLMVQAFKNRKTFGRDANERVKKSGRRWS